MPPMDYAEARDAFFAPRPDAVVGTGFTSPARTLRDAVEPLAAVSFWSAPSNEAYAALGLDFLTGYVWSRSSVLGEADPAVVAAAFGVFEPGAVAGLLTAAREAATLQQVRAAREDGAVQALHLALGEPDGVEPVAEALLRAADAADVVGRPLFAGARAQQVPQDPWGRLWHAATLLRECRGDSHLAACVAYGLTGLEANLLTEAWVGYEPLSYTGTRAWSPESMAAAQAALRDRGLLADGRLTEAGSALRQAVEQATDLAMAPVVAALGDDLDDVVARCSAWGRALTDHGWFPPDPYKHAAG